MRASLTLLSLQALVLAQTPGVPQGGAPCDPAQNGWDCSLGGVCNASSVCQCDIQFTGPSCALLNLQAPKDDQGGTCGRSFDGYHSWGGRPIYYPADGKWHASLSFLCRHEGLGAWTTVSASAHFIADAPDGVYEWGPEQCTADGICTPSVVPWSHNTVFMQNPAEAAKGAAYQIWHIGDGVAPAADWNPCFNASQVGARFSLASASAQRASAPPRQPSPGNAAYVAYASSPSGPWTRGLDNGQVPINFTGAWTGALAGNPAPLVMPDGSVNLYFTAVPCPPNSGAKAANCIAVATSTNGFEGPFQMNAARHPITYPESEDPSVFRDKRGNYHLLTNVNTCHARCAQGIECGGHAWSRDGFTFSNLTIGAFGPAVTFANGTVWRNAYVERPLVSLAPDGVTPVALHLGMGRTGYTDCCNWPQLFCTGAPGEVCGPTTTPAAPPPAPLPAFRLRNGAACLGFNASRGFPCSRSGPAGGCPLLMLPCSEPGTAFNLTAAGAAGAKPTAIYSALLSAQAGAPLAGLDVDCSNTAPNTLVKLLESGFDSFTVAGGRIQYERGGCLNTGQGAPVPPCGAGGETYLQNQVKIAPCDSAEAQGWSVEAA